MSRTAAGPNQLVPYRAIAEALGISSQRVQEIERNALRKLRKQISLEMMPDEPRVDPSIYI